ncbi:Sortilin- receptor, partial [Cladochytrium tenue]
PYGSAASFVVFGTTTTGETAAVFLDFASAFPRDCTGVADGDSIPSPDGDYELWYPASLAADNRGCIFGESLAFLRRKSDHICRAPETLTAGSAAIRRGEPCTCAAADFECDAGFARNASAECAPVLGAELPPDVCVGGVLMRTTGYRKSRRTKCQGGLSLDVPEKEFCAKSISWFAWLLIFAAALGVPAAVTYWFVASKRGGRIRLTVDSEGLFAAERAPGGGAGSGGDNEFLARAAATLVTAGRSAAVILLEAGEAATAALRRVYEAARLAALRRAGYAPVRTALDDAIDRDADLLDLEDDDDDDDGGHNGGGGGGRGAGGAGYSAVRGTA